jgi:hypothetical protein
MAKRNAAFDPLKELATELRCLLYPRPQPRQAYTSGRFAMKSLIVTSIFGVVVLAAIATPASAVWSRALDARPEAVATGSALLALASLLRRNLPTRRDP